VILWLAGIIGAFLTALYSFRMIFITFYGEAKTQPSFLPGKLMTVPLIILAVLSLVGGFVELPASIGNIHLFSNLIDNTLPAIVNKEKEHSELLFQVLSSVIALTGIYIAYLIYYKKPALSEPFSHSRLNKFFEKGWGFDKLYDTLLVKPLIWLSVIDKNDFIDLWNISLSRVVLFFNQILSKTQNGKLRWYLLSFAIGIAIILTYILGK
jgi:NADH-quinone oxidoreductase subunit L